MTIIDFILELLGIKKRYFIKSHYYKNDKTINLTAIAKCKYIDLDLIQEQTSKQYNIKKENIHIDEITRL